MRKIGIEDIDDIALGSSLLGSGGGGDPYMGRLEDIAASEEVWSRSSCLTLMKCLTPGPSRLFAASALRAVSLEKGTNESSIPGFAAMMERSTCAASSMRSFAFRAGGMNSMVPISADARAGLPLINADGMGPARFRAFSKTRSR